jgi:hypothetical protein
MDRHHYSAVRSVLMEEGYRDEIEWSQAVLPPASPLALWREYAFVVLNSGMKAQIAQGIWEKVRPQVEGGDSTADVFGHKAKAAVIDEGFERRVPRFLRFHELETDAARLAWCVELPWIGEITKYHLAKNLGVDCAKPDRWLERVAAAAGETVDALCARLGRETGDRIATVDLVIWRACNLGIVVPGDRPGSQSDPNQLERTASA